MWKKDRVPALRDSFSPKEKVLDMRGLYEANQNSEEVFPAIYNRIASKKKDATNQCPQSGQKNSQMSKGASIHFAPSLF